MQCNLTACSLTFLNCVSIRIVRLDCPLVLQNAEELTTHCFSRLQELSISDAAASAFLRERYVSLIASLRYLERLEFSALSPALASHLNSAISLSWLQVPPGLRGELRRLAAGGCCVDEIKL
jgi:hypothetical protein